MLHPPVTRGSSVPKHVAFSPLKGPALPEEHDAEAIRAYITARADASSSCASEDPCFHDAPSEVGSFVSAASSFTDASSFSEGGSPPEVVNARYTDADDAPSERGDGEAHQPWEEERKDEACQREEEARPGGGGAVAEETAALRRRVEELKREVDQLSSSGGTPRVADSEKEAEAAAAARLVAAAFARAVATEEAADEWAGEVKLLRQRVERSALMENIALQQRQRQQEAQDVMARRALQVGFAVGCLGLGALAAFLVVRSSRK